MTRKLRTVSTYDTFIVATGPDTIKPNGEARKLIRSHVMQGKNAGKGKGSTKARRGQEHGTIRSAGGLSGEGVDDATSPWYVSPERNLSLLRAGPSNFAVGGLIREFMAVMKQAMYPIERYVGVGSDEPGWFQDSAMCRDTAYAHIVAYSALAFFDTKRLYTSGSRSGERALVHMNRGIRLLRKRIRAQDFASTDATIFLVLALGMFSEAHGELDAAQKHLYGLHQLVRLRGGIKALSGKRFLQIKCCRLDLAIALRTGKQPLFFSDEVDDIFSGTWSLGPRQALVIPTLVQLCSDPRAYDADKQLADIWLDLRTFTTTVNLARRTHTKISPEFYQNTLIAAHYRLHRLSLQTVAQSETHHVFRLAMLAFSTTVFFEIRDDRFRSLASAFQCSLQAWHIEQHKAPHKRAVAGLQLQELNLWMILVAATSVLRTPEHHRWLREELRKTTQILQLAGWDLVYTILNRLLWVDAIHNATARAFLESMAAS